MIAKRGAVCADIVNINCRERARRHARSTRQHKAIGAGYAIACRARAGRTFYVARQALAKCAKILIVHLVIIAHLLSGDVVPRAAILLTDGSIEHISSYAAEAARTARARVARGHTW